MAPKDPKKKLLVLPINGFLLHRAYIDQPNTIPRNRMQPDLCSDNSLIYKRPFCEEFMKFCFERFDVAIWSSDLEDNMGEVLDKVMGGELRSKLLFTWDQSQCKETNVMCLDNKDEPVFLKELFCLWRKSYGLLRLSQFISDDLLDSLYLKFLAQPFVEAKYTYTWSDGDYTEFNTLLITDPLNAIMNDPNTAISPSRYDPENNQDDLLGPNSELRLFLDGLVEAEDVPTYVKAHPIGDPQITSSHPDWKHYRKAIPYYAAQET